MILDAPPRNRIRDSQALKKKPWAFKFIIIFMVTLWLFNIAMENGPFIDGLPIKHGDFPWLC